MNICFFCVAAVDPQKGGLERVTRVLADALISKGHCISFLSMTGDNRETCDKDLQSFFPNDDVYSLENESFLEKFILERQIDIVVFQPGAAISVPFPVVFKKSNVRLIVAIHTDPEYYRGIALQKFTLKYGNVVAKISRPIIAVKTLLRKRKQVKIYRKNASLADKIILLSEKYIPTFSSYIRSEDANKTAAISNPISIKYHAGADVKKNEILYVGRMTLRDKRVDLLLKIWTLVQNDFPEWHLRLVGGGPDLEKLKGMAKRLHLSRISFEGFQNPEPYYRSAKIFCLTSAFEGFPMVFSEAATFGCIPIAFDSFPVASEFIHDEKNGFLIPPFNVERYANKLAELMTNYPTEIAENAKKDVERYALDPIVSKWIALFEEVMKNNGTNNPASKRSI